MFELKALSRESVERALKKAERYRLLNEPWDAESICRDVLEVDPANQEAIIALVLSITDQFRSDAGSRLEETRRWLAKLRGEYERAYYSGIVYERQASALLSRRTTGHGPVVYDWLRKAMEHYERAEAIRPQGNDDALLRWNTCARLINRYPQLRPDVPSEATMLE
jgi:hypothetical protein